jgi:ligand-binding sensor domain-containing protein
MAEDDGTREPTPSHQVVNQSGGAEVNANDVEIGGDVVGRDKITTKERNTNQSVVVNVIVPGPAGTEGTKGTPPPEPRAPETQPAIPPSTQGLSVPKPTSYPKRLLIIGAAIVAAVLIGLWIISKLAPPPPPPDIQLSITSPKTGAEVDVRGIITGTYTGLPKGWNIRGVTHKPGDEAGAYYLHTPQDFPEGAGTFSVDGYCGDRTAGIGQPCEFFVIAAQVNSPAEAALNKRPLGSTDPLPQDGVFRSAPITVTRVGPTAYWYVDYWADTNMVSGQVSYTEEISTPFIFKNWAYTSPTETIPADNWSARFIRRVDFPDGGIYRFNVEHDDGVRVSVDGTTIIDKWGGAGLPRETQDITLTHGFHEIAIDFEDLKEVAALGFWYEKPEEPVALPPVSNNYWLVTYFPNKYFKNDPIVHERYSPDYLNLNWSDDKGPLIGNGRTTQVLVDNFSTVSTREVYFKEGLYQFEISGDSGVGLSIDNRDVFQNDLAWKECNPCHAVVDLAEGTYTLRVYQWEDVGNARVSVSWKPADAVWKTFSNPYDTRVMAVEDKYVWTGGDGGLVRWNKHDLRTQDSFHPENGLPDNIVNALLIDRQENLWVGTGDGYDGGNGLAWFNGTDWRYFNTTNGLCSSTVTTLFQDRDDSLWVGTAEGLAHYDPQSGKWDCYTIANGLDSNYPVAVYRDRNNNLWVSMGGGGMSVLQPDNIWHTFTRSEIGIPVTDTWGLSPITEDAEGNIWLGSWSGLAKYDGKKWQVLTEKTGLPFGGSRAGAMRKDDGALWFGTYDGAAQLAQTGNDKIWELFTTHDGLASNRVTGLAFDRGGVLWAGHDDNSGISRYDDKAWIAASPNPGTMVPNRITSIVRAQDGNLWLGTGRPPSAEGTGVYTFTGTTAEKFVQPDCPQDRNYVDVIYQTENGNMWFGFGAAADGVSRYDGEKCESFNGIDDLAGKQVVDILQDCDGGMWFATLNGGVSYYSAGEWYTYNKDNARFPSNQVNALFKDNGCHIWLGTDGGVVYRPDKDHWNTFTVEDGLTSNQITSISQGTDGAMWFGSTDKGVSRYDPKNQNWQTYRTTDGLLSDTIYTLHAGPNGWIWAGTPDGVSIYTGSKWLNYTPQDGLASRHVRTIWEDNDGTVWLGTSGGLSRLQFKAEVP